MIQRAEVLKLPVALPLEAGGLLVDAEVAMEAYGHPSPDQALVLLHDFMQSHRALDGWGKQLLGRGNPIDPAQYWVVSLNLLGSPFGSTSASMLQGQEDPYAFTVEDMARAAASAMRVLGVKKPRVVAGVGLGGMVALKMAALFPDLVAGVMTVGTAAALSKGLREHLLLSWAQHRAGTLRKAHLELLRRHHDRHALVKRFGDNAAVEAFLAGQAEAFLERFDPRCYASLAQAYGAADLRDCLSSITCRALLVAGTPDEIAPVSRVREAYHRISGAGAKARFYEIPAEGGHAELLAEIGRIKGPVREFLSSLD
ncbi:MAG: alpha/beta fold hydrolase [Archangiaceae bacterium]|nr:alpha/beta fold hydrolase [Archangiaceae bacterium]